jgi:hypothetical protein
MRVHLAYKSTAWLSSLQKVYYHYQTVTFEFLAWRTSISEATIDNDDATTGIEVPCKVLRWNIRPIIPS